jgi:hypothetical protein
VLGGKPDAEVQMIMGGKMKTQQSKILKMIAVVGLSAVFATSALTVNAYSSVGKSQNNYNQHNPYDNKKDDKKDRDNDRCDNLRSTFCNDFEKDDLDKKAKEPIKVPLAFNPKKDLPKDYGDRNHDRDDYKDKKHKDKKKKHKGDKPHHDNDDCDDDTVEVPEPGTIGLAVIGSTLLWLGRRKRK